MVNVVLNENVDLLHVHYAIPHASAAFMAKMILRSQGRNVPVVTTLHGTDITLVGKDESYEPVVTFSINESDGVTSVSEDLKRDTYKHFNIHREIEVIPNFIDLTRFKRQDKDHFKRAICPNGEKLLVHTSNFRRVKRMDDAVKIFYHVQQQIPAKLLLIGDGPERGRIEKLVKELGIYDSVRFLGKLDAVEEVLSVADLFLMPSENESFGLAALEALACEVPLITTNVGGLPELNVPGVTGFLSNVGDVDEMTKNALFVLQDDQLPTFKANALTRAKVFELSKILPMYEAHYERVMAASRL